VEVATRYGKFGTLLAAAAAAGLVDTLNSAGPFTVFAPDDKTFSDEVDDIDALLADPVALKALLLNHVVPGRITSADLVTKTRYPTAGGGTIFAYWRNEWEINNGDIIVADLTASNGVIHVIDDVLRQVRDGEAHCIDFRFNDECDCRQDRDCKFRATTRCGCAEAQAASCCNGYVPPGTIPEVAAANGSFSTLLTAATAAGLVDFLTNEEDLTVFAPTDAAFAKVKNLDAIIADKAALQTLLKNHIVRNVKMAADLRDKQSIVMYGGSLAKVSITNGKVMIDNANVVAADVEAINGVIHVIDAVLTYEEEVKEEVKEEVTKEEGKEEGKEEEKDPVTSGSVAKVISVSVMSLLGVVLLCL